jgi:cytosine-specific methyltransferase|nr:MAG TPA: Cytosine specific methyltransferase [Caudoviricetes sp.]
MRRLTYASVCSGIEAVSVAWKDLDLKPLWFSEIEPFPCAVLAHHYPNIPNHGDMTTLPERILSGEIEAPDILVGGTPCQAFSVAGLRKSLEDERGNLTLVFVRILNAINAIRRRHRLPDAVVLWENVPGVLSTRDNAFGCFLAALLGESKELVPTGSRWTGAGIVRSDQREIAWRILDAQYFGVPQRRRRVFLAAGNRDRRVAQILFERQGEAGHPAAGAEAWQNPAADAPAGSHWDDPTNPHPTLNQSGSGGIIGQSNQEIFSQRGGGLIPVRMRGFGDYIQDDTASTVKARDHKDATDLIVVHGRQDPCTSDKAFTLDCQHNGNTNVVCIHGNTIGRQLHNGGNGTGAIQDGTSYTLTATDRHAVSDGLQVRRLTPVECERLQGFPDNHTQIPWRGKPAADCPDSLRYKAIGNSMAVPVMRWIGERICGT